MPSSNNIRRLANEIKRNPALMKFIKNSGGIKAVMSDPMMKQALMQKMSQAGGTRRRRRNYNRGTSKKGSRRSRRSRRTRRSKH